MIDLKAHLLQLPRKLKDPTTGQWVTRHEAYLPVRARIMAFREQYPQGTIETRPLTIDVQQGFACFEAIAMTGDGGRAVAHGSETKAGFEDFIERSECVPLDSEILTREGFKRYDKVCIGEEVLAYNPAVDSCVWTPLLKVTTYANTSVSRLHGGRGFDVVCTPDHSWAVYYRATWKGKLYEYRKLRQASRLNAAHRIILSANAPGGSHPLTPRDAAIIGWIMTDGSLHREKSHHRWRADISQSKPDMVKEIRALLGPTAKESVGQPYERMFPSGHTYACRAWHRFWLSANETQRLLDAAGIAGPADLPAMVSQYSHEARAAMLDAMMKGDGTKRGDFGKKRKPGVMEAWRILATLEGIALGQLKHSAVGHIPTQRLKKGRFVYASELVLEDAGRADVWCPTTAYGTWVMKQNERVMITGNTRAVGRCLGLLGFGTEYAMEMDELPHVADAPVSTTAATPPATTNGNGHPPTPPPTKGAPKNLVQKSDVLRAIQDELARLSRPVGELPALFHAAFGDEVTTWELVCGESLHTVKHGLTYLKTLTPEVPHADDSPPPATPQPTPAPTEAVPQDPQPDGAAGSLSAPAPSPDDAAERDRVRLRAEIAKWPLKVKAEEAEYIITHHPYSKARQLLWQARREAAA